MRQVAWMLLSITPILSCASDTAVLDTQQAADATSTATACRPVETPWTEGAPVLLPCKRTEEPCDGMDNDNDGIADPHCPTRTCTSDADCTLGGLIKDTDCCVRVCDSGSCGDDDGCGGTCPCDGEPALPVCTQIDGWPRTNAPMLCQGVLCPPGLKCVEGACVEPGNNLPGQQCNSGADCPLTSGCVPFEPDEPPRCLMYCNEAPCPTGYVCSYQEYPTKSGGFVIHETCRQPGLCELGRRGCSGEMSACYGDPTCVQALVCAQTACEVDRLNDQSVGDHHEDSGPQTERPEGEGDAWDNIDPACLAQCLDDIAGQLASDFALCIRSTCNL